MRSPNRNYLTSLMQTLSVSATTSSTVLSNGFLRSLTNTISRWLFPPAEYGRSHAMEAIMGGRGGLWRILGERRSSSMIF